MESLKQYLGVDAYKSAGRLFARYWYAYGGLSAQVASPYFHVAVVLTVLGSVFWNQNPWWEISISVLPSLLGFTVAALTFLLSLSGDGFIEQLFVIELRAKVVAYSESIATFVHFILVQVAGLLMAIFAKLLFVPPAEWIAPLISRFSTLFEIGRIIYWGTGFFFFMYALTTCVAAIMAIFRLAEIRVKYEALSDEEKEALRSVPPDRAMDHHSADAE